MAIHLDYRVPAAALQPFVTLFYHFRTALPLFTDIGRADHAQLRFLLSPGAGNYGFADGSVQKASDFHLIGPTSGVIRICAHGPVEVVGMGLQPAGWAAMIGVDASAMCNRVIDARALFGPVATRAEAALRVAEGTDAKIAIVAALVDTLVARADSRTLSFARQIDGWLADSASPDVDALVAMTGLSRRQTERRCNTLYGSPPKVLARKYRALRAAVGLATGSATLDALIAEGFYDQSHLIRELKQFTGLTPRQLRTEPSALARMTMNQRVALGGQVHPIISQT